MERKISTMSKIKDNLIDIEGGRIVSDEIQDKTVHADYFDGTFVLYYEFVNN